MEGRDSDDGSVSHVKGSAKNGEMEQVSGPPIISAKANLGTWESPGLWNMDVYCLANSIERKC